MDLEYMACSMPDAEMQAGNSFDTRNLREEMNVSPTVHKTFSFTNQNAMDVSDSLLSPTGKTCQTSLFSEGGGHSPYKTPKRSNSVCNIARRTKSFTWTFQSNKTEEQREADMLSIPCPLFRASSSEFCQIKKSRVGGSALSFSATDLPHIMLEQTPTIPTINGSHADLNCITHHTMKEILAGMYNPIFDEIFIIDCRFSYEYTGGHVRGAINMPSTDDISECFIRAPIQKKIAVIFYCEFSSKRGPSGYRFLRALDRQANMARYPQLFYPEVYLLEGGYKNFYENCAECCDPRGYVEMRDKRFCEDMKENCKELRLKTWKRSRSLIVTKTVDSCKDSQS